VSVRIAARAHHGSRYEPIAASEVLPDIDLQQLAGHRKAAALRNTNVSIKIRDTYGIRVATGH